jgi:hypothetical protein
MANTKARIETDAFIHQDDLIKLIKEKHPELNLSDDARVIGCISHLEWQDWWQGGDYYSVEFIVETDRERYLSPPEEGLGNATPTIPPASTNPNQ